MVFMEETRYFVKTATQLQCLEDIKDDKEWAPKEVKR